MAQDAISIGIMHPAFSVSKTILLNWIQKDFDLTYAKVENCASGAFYCQVCDCLFGKVKMKDVKWDAKSEYEYTYNWQIVQRSFKLNKITKNIDVPNLTRAKFQDNLEFLQWMKHFYDCVYDNRDYDPAARRAKSKSSSACRNKPSDKKATTKRTTTRTTGTTGVKRTTTKTGGAASAKHAKEMTELKEQLAEMQQTAEGLEKERDYYYETLRSVELFCQKNEDPVDATKTAVLAILYQNDEAEGDAADGDEAETAEAETEAADDDDTM